MRFLLSLLAFNIRLSRSSAPVKHLVDMTLEVGIVKHFERHEDYCIGTTDGHKTNGPVVWVIMDQPLEFFL